MMSTTGDLDVEVSNDREDGEIEDSDVEEGTYIPLARPEAFNPPSLVHMQIQDEQSDDQSPIESSESESDDEPYRHPKRTKVKPQVAQQSKNTNKKEKYNIWCKPLEEDLLTEDMVSCDLTKKSRYGVESYDYTIKYRLNDNLVSKKMFGNETSYVNDNVSNKRRHSDRTNVKLRLGKRVNSNQQMQPKHEPKFLSDLSVNTSDPVEIVGGDIADKLSEEKKELVERIVQVLGANKAMEIYKETQRVEADGGMLVMNGTRRRTPGGVYFFLLKRNDDVTPEMISQIFNEDRKQNSRRIRKIRAGSRQKVMEQLKQSLTDSELPSLLSRGEATVQSEHGSNPPPSPATDARECSSDSEAHSSDPTDRSAPSRTRSVTPPPHSDTRQLQDYHDDDDFLEVMCNDDMDLF